ncbi:hypothetical protein Misp06_04028 [Microbulbifer sp. NBRC 101763]
MDSRVNYPVNQGGFFAIKPFQCLFFKHPDFQAQITTTAGAAH